MLWRKRSFQAIFFTASSLRVPLPPGLASGVGINRGVKLHEKGSADINISFKIYLRLNHGISMPTLRASRLSRYISPCTCARSCKSSRLLVKKCQL